MIAAADCMECAHATLAEDGSVATCDAFPKGIPEDIIRGKVHHDQPYPGDHGILYQPLGGSKGEQVPAEVGSVPDPAGPYDPVVGGGHPSVPVPEGLDPLGGAH